MISGGIGVGKGLKIGNIIGAAVCWRHFPADPFLCSFNLFPYIAS